MKVRLMLAAVCLAAAVTFSVCVYSFVEKTCDSLEAEARSALSAPTDAALLERAGRLCAQWRAVSPVFCVFIHHKDADALRERFLFVEEKHSAGDCKALRGSLEECLFVIEAIAEGEKPKAANIF